MLPSWRLKGGGQVVSAACHTQKSRCQGADTGGPGCGPMNGSLLGVLHGEGGSGRQGYRQSVDNFKLVNYYLIQQKVMKHLMDLNFKTRLHGKY